MDKNLFIFTHFVTGCFIGRQTWESSPIQGPWIREKNEAIFQRFAQKCNLGTVQAVWTRLWNVWLWWTWTMVCHGIRSLRNIYIYESEPSWLELKEFQLSSWPFSLQLEIEINKKLAENEPKFDSQFFWLIFIINLCVLKMTKLCS